MEEIKVGDKVDVTITGATVIRVSDDFVRVMYGPQGERGSADVNGVDSPAVNVARVTPTILPGDVFEDNDSALWHAVSGDRVTCVTAARGVPWRFGQANDRFGLSLVSRVQDAA